MNLKYFPFDKHTCEIEFFLTTRFGVNITGEHFNYYEGPGVVFHKNLEPNDQFVSGSGEWDLISIKLDATPRITEVYGNKITYPIFKIILELERRPSFYVIILMLPSVLISSISVIGFLLPSESGEKVSLQLTALLSYSLVFLLIVDIIPPVGGNLPLIGNFLYIISRSMKLIRTLQ